ncbi:hypothetical protein [Halobaculum lipolyticum]|uniref:Uncharacterized protein n=1 Tax=Halobaculum lipolyticum TaxID=3032001 RepID=A0ABD5WA08_9EURY|nr:hypothetical protein [Halobaculum sp. DT31]
MTPAPTAATDAADAADAADPADADAVRDTLRALATGATPNGTRDHERVVAAAEAALTDVESAAEFADGGGFDRVRTVVDAAGVDGAVERRARAVLDTLAAYRAAYRRASDDRDPAGAAGSARDAGGAGTDAAVRDAARDAPDHFRSTHDSHIPRAELPDDNR